MKLSLFDLHCDTPYEMLRTKQGLRQNNLAVSLNKAKNFVRYVQVLAFWTDRRLNDEEGWEYMLRMYHNLHTDEAILAKDACISGSYSTKTLEKPMFLLGIEDMRILAGNLDRVDQLYQMGFRILTPLWAGDTCIGGSHNTENGLTEFGKAALSRALELGMIPDISHASQKSADDIFELCEQADKPVIATHSNAYAIHPVSRNLTDRQIQTILARDGLIGINLFHRFISSAENVMLDHLLAHIEHFLALGAHQHLSLGGDMDGCDLLPEIQNLAELPRLAEKMLQKNYSEHLIQDLFFENANRFACQYLSM